jgi:hypothetical protein
MGELLNPQPTLKQLFMTFARLELTAFGRGKKTAKPIQLKEIQKWIFFCSQL